jgi:tripartite-type tricarboxylate transporter receptor subunit TctC
MRCALKQLTRRAVLAGAAGALGAMVSAISALFVGLAFASSASAQDYPGTRPVKIIVPFAAGSSTDALGRVLADQLQQLVGGSFVIDNMAGANGVIAAQAAARAAPDGHTLFLSTNTTHSANPHLVKDLPYDPVKDFAPISRLTAGQFPLVVHPGVPAKTIVELIAYAKANPAKLSYGTSNSTSLVGAEWFKSLGQLDIVGVPYKSNPTAVTDLLAGRVDMMFMDQASAVPMIKAGKLRVLAVSGAKRAPLLPDVPTVAEAGLGGFALNSWTGLFGPVTLPPQIAQRLSDAINRALKKPDVIERLQGLGYEVIASTPAGLGEVVKQQLEIWGRAVQTAKIPRQ